VVTSILRGHILWLHIRNRHIKLKQPATLQNFKNFILPINIYINNRSSLSHSVTSTNYCLRGCQQDRSVLHLCERIVSQSICTQNTTTLWISNWNSSHLSLAWRYTWSDVLDQKERKWQRPTWRNGSCSAVQYSTKRVTVAMIPTRSYL
jgi:hypothetical protein